MGGQVTSDEEWINLKQNYFKEVKMDKSTIWKNLNTLFNERTLDNKQCYLELVSFCREKVPMSKDTIDRLVEMEMAEKSGKLKGGVHETVLEYINTKL